MEEHILNNIHQLYRSHIVTLVLFLILGCVTLFVVVGVVKFDLIKPKIGKIILMMATIISLVVVLLVQILSIIPIYKDYEESSYVIIENARLTILTEASGVVDKTNTVLIDNGSTEPFKLKMQTDLSLSFGSTYTGTIAYTINSGYVVWYSFD